MRLGNMEEGRRKGESESEKRDRKMKDDDDAEDDGEEGRGEEEGSWVEWRKDLSMREAAAWCLR